MNSYVGRVGFVLAVLGGVAFSSCGASDDAGDDDDEDGDLPPCRTQRDCPDGFVCVSNDCIAPGGRGGSSGNGGDAGGPSAGDTGQGASGGAVGGGGASQGGSGGDLGGGTGGDGAGADQGGTTQGGSSQGGSGGSGQSGSGQGGSGGSPCPGGERTTLRGVVYDPSGTMPLYNALVYVPSAALAPFPATVSCDRCFSSVSGSPVSAALTNSAGTFVLENVPSGSNVRLVIQVGKWRRVVTLPPVTACTMNEIDDPNLTRLPRNRSEGDLPRIALTTGGSDALECLLLKMGISESEFTSDTGAGSVHLYAGGAPDGEGRGADRLASGATLPLAATLWGSPSKLAGYDLLVMSCEGGQLADAKSSYLANIENYMNAGGHVLFDHLHFYWLNHGSSALQATAEYIGVGEDLPEPTLATVDETFPKGAAFADWLLRVGASTARGQLSISQGQHSVSSVTPPTAQWLSATNPNENNTTSIQHLTFNTPPGVPLANQCGRAAFTDMHVSAGTGDSSVPGEPFPTGCSANWSPQARALAFLVYDLAGCVASDSAAPVPP